MVKIREHNSIARRHRGRCEKCHKRKHRMVGGICEVCAQTFMFRSKGTAWNPLLGRRSRRKP